ERRAQDVDQVVAEQDRADHALAVAEQAVHATGRLVAILLQLMHPPAAGRRQRRLRRREQGRDRQQDQDPNEYQGEGRHGCAPSSIRKLRIAAAGTSLATKAWPTPRARMKVSLPPSAFLSC